MEGCMRVQALNMGVFHRGACVRRVHAMKSANNASIRPFTRDRPCNVTYSSCKNASMKIHVLSDLHTELWRYDPVDLDCDVVVLAGDIGVGLGALEWINSAYSDKPVVYVPGNHEYYGHNLSVIDSLKRQSRPNVYLLDNDEVEIDGVRFLGSTLWTDFALFGEAEVFFAQKYAGDNMNDFSVIKSGVAQFLPVAATEIHKRSRAWLERMLADRDDGPTVVVTHHAPSAMSISERFKADPLSPAFASRLEPIIEEFAPALWIHGHTHDAFDYEIYDTRVVCNPRGYPEEAERYGFDPSLIVEI